MTGCVWIIREWTQAGTEVENVLVEESGMKRQANAYGVLVATLAGFCAAQELRRHDSPESWCSPVELRVVAKLGDGSAANLQRGELQVEFDRGLAGVISLTSFAKVPAEGGLTNILFVIPPYSEFGASAGINGIVNTLAHAEGFRFRAAVLGPDGVGSGYSRELSVLDRELHAAAKGKHWDAGFRAVRVTTTRKEVRVFGPRVMQMIPYAGR